MRERMIHPSLNLVVQIQEMGREKKENPAGEKGENWKWMMFQKNQTILNKKWAKNLRIQVLDMRRWSELRWRQEWNEIWSKAHPHLSCTTNILLIYLCDRTVKNDFYPLFHPPLLFSTWCTFLSLSSLIYYTLDERRSKRGLWMITVVNVECMDAPSPILVFRTWGMENIISSSLFLTLCKRVGEESPLDAASETSEE